MTPELPEPVTTIDTPLAMHYTFVAGTGRSLFLSGLAQKKILARDCPSCSRTYVPPPTQCSSCLVDLGPPKELDGTGIIETFCVINFPFPGQTLTPPYAVAHIKLSGATTTLMHLIGDVEPAEVKIGMTVEPVWVDDGELGTSLASIRHFRPVSDGPAAMGARDA